MRVALDVSALTPGFRAHAQRGTGRYVSELKRALEASSEAELIPFRYSEVGRGSWLDSLVGCLPAGRMTIRHQLLYPFSLGKAQIDSAQFIHFPVHIDAPSWVRQPFAVTVLDLIPLLFREHYAPSKNDLRFQFARWLELRSIRRASLVFAISENTKRDVVRLLGVDPSKIVVTPLGVDPRFFDVPRSDPEKGAARRQLGLPEDSPLLLYVGGIDYRKNIEGMVQTLALLKEGAQAAGRPVPHLIHIGKIQEDHRFPHYEQTIRDAGCGEQFLLQGFVDDENLLTYFQASDCFFFPSRYEGFGLPPLEAQAAGLPVVAADSSSIPEVLGSSALLFDPDKAEAAAGHLERCLNDSGFSYSLSEKGRANASRFSWDRTARLTIDAYLKFGAPVSSSHGENRV